jgi:hypothetical protein
MTIFKLSVRWCLLLILLALPLGGQAQVEKKAYLCIEKRDGEIVKLPITENSPEVHYIMGLPDANGHRDRGLEIRYIDRSVSLLCDEVKRLTTTIEVTNALEPLNMDEGDATSGIYTLSGVRVRRSGNMNKLPKGIYVIKQGSKIQKQVNR